MVEVDTAHQEENQLDKKIYKAKGIGKIVALVVGTIATVFIFFNFIMGITVVDGVSMRPTLKTGDILLVWKLP
jgi:signal peptidase I